MIILKKFAGDGLRTLCLAYREIDQQFFDEWFMRYRNSAIQNNCVDERLFDELETNLILIGATGVEDKLQDGVSKTIQNLSMAGIKIWVLTGDKQGDYILKFFKNLIKLVLFRNSYQYWLLVPITNWWYGRGVYSGCDWKEWC